MKIGVVGYGVVGRHMEADILRAGHECVVFDVRPELAAGETHQSINACDAAFVCVSTPSLDDGRCDTSALVDVFSWLYVPIAIIRSTVEPGTTLRLKQKLLSSDIDVAYCPEFIGEGVNPPYSAMQQPPFLIIGGDAYAQRRAANVFARLYNAECELIFTDSTTAELAKYAENYFLALKVTWANELFDIAERVGADFNDMMAALTHDYRIGRSHTRVPGPDGRGWAGRCLPKDTAALLAVAGRQTAPLLAALRDVNDRHRAK